MKWIFANWKMHFSLNEADNFCDTLDKNKNLIIAPPIIYLSYLALKYKNKHAFASQDITDSASQEGKYTGEVSAMMLKSININYSLIGHLERRKKENQDCIKAKIEHCLNYGITPIVCINNLNEITLIPKTKHTVFIAYEPHYAVGSGESANKQEIIKFVDCFKNILEKNYYLLYGGSVDAKNLSRILSIVDGVLVGRAALNIGELKQIISIRDLLC